MRTRAACAVVAWVAFVAGCSSKFIAPNPPADNATAISFLKLIRDGQLDAAWNSTSSEFKSFMGKAEFTKYVKQHPALKANTDDGTLSTKNEKDLALAMWTFKSLGTKPASIIVTLGREQDQWKVAGLKVE